KNNDGYKNMIQISSFTQLEKGCSLETLEVSKEHLICIIPTETLFIKTMILNDKFVELNELFNPFQNIFAKGDLYIGLEMYEQDSGSLLIEKMKQYEADSGVQVVALHDVRYLEAKDDISYDCLQAMKKNEKWEIKARNNDNEQRHMRTKQEIMHA